MTDPSVSVALASFDGARYIGAQLRSIAAQTVPVAEVVLADDGSRDGTVDTAVAALAEFGSAAPELRVVSRDRVGGVVPNFARALVATRGSLIALADQDDVWHPDRVEAALEAFATAPHALLVHSDARLVDDDGTELGTAFAVVGYGPAEWRQVRSGAGFELLLRRNTVTGATVMMRRELLGLAGDVPPGWLHDEWLGLVAASRGGLAIVERPLIDYRQHGGNEVGMVELTTGGKIRRMLQRGRSRNERLLLRAQSLAERAPILGLSPERAQDAAQKLLHEQVRSGLSRHRIARFVPVARELGTGRYARFGRGAADAVRDLLQPL